MHSYNKNQIQMQNNNIEKEGWTIQSSKKKKEKDNQSQNQSMSQPQTQTQTHSLSDVEDSNQNKNKPYNVSCMNCGKKGHLTKKCSYPIMSLGIIAIYLEKNTITNTSIDLNNIISFTKKIQTNYLFENDELKELTELYNNISTYNQELLNHQIKYLMIRRKNSLSYVDFIRGKYDLDDYEYLYNTILMMTNDEKYDLMTKSFDELWRDMWNMQLGGGSHNQEYEDSKMKFNKLREGYFINKCEILFPISFQSIIAEGIREYREPEWGFPKGRRNINEKNIECAKREFKEETGLNETDYHILNMTPLEETYLGSNHIRYKHIYYFAQMQEMNMIEVDQMNIYQKTEIGDIGWFSFHEGYEIIREYNRERRNILFNTHTFLKNLIMNFKCLYQNFYEKNKMIF